jgi:hypothetical protein
MPPPPGIDFLHNLPNKALTKTTKLQNLENKWDNFQNLQNNGVKAFRRCYGDTILFLVDSGSTCFDYTLDVRDEGENSGPTLIHGQTALRSAGMAVKIEGTSKRVGRNQLAIANDDCSNSFTWVDFSPCRSPRRTLRPIRQFRALEFDLTSKRFGLRQRHYVLLVRRDEHGRVRKMPVPLHYVYAFVAVALIGAFTVAGLAGSYSRMLIKTARFNQLRNDHNSLQKDYAHLEMQAHEKDVQAASLGSLATEISALYGLTANKLAAPMSHVHLHSAASNTGSKAANGTLISDATSNFSDDTYYKSLDTFYSLRNSAISGAATHAIDGPSALNSLSGMGDMDASIDAPSLWPVAGRITSSFGERVDPVLRTGEGEFHTGIDIAAPAGTPIRATADGTVKLAGMVNGYGREVVLDHGHGMETCYAHMSAFAVMAGESVVRGQVIGYVGVSGRTVGGANLHYEVRIHNTPVNPYKYLHTTLAGLGPIPANSGL